MENTCHFIEIGACGLDKHNDIHVWQKKFDLFAQIDFYDWDFVILKRYLDKDWFKEREKKSVVLLRTHFHLNILYIYTACMWMQWIWSTKQIHFKKAHYLCVKHLFYDVVKSYK